MTGLVGFAAKAIAFAGIAAGGAFVAQGQFEGGPIDTASQAEIDADADAGANPSADANVAADAGLSAEATAGSALAECSRDCLALEGPSSLEASAISGNEISVEAKPELSSEFAAASSAEGEAQGAVEAQGSAETGGAATQVSASSETEAEAAGNSSGSLAGELSVDGGIAVEAD